MLRKIITKLKFLLKQQKAYFGERNYTTYNIQLLKIICLCVLFVFCAVEIVTFIAWGRFVINPFYIVPCAFYLVMYICLRYIGKREITQKESLCLTIINYVVCMIYSIEISIFPMPDVPSVYFALVLIAAPVIFYMPIIYSLCLNTFFTAVFFVMVILFKPQFVWAHELFEATVSFILSIAVGLIMLTMRSYTADISERYRKISMTDGLTGFYNKKTGEHIIRKCFEEELDADETCGIVIMDIDDFKNVNDEYGHSEGDFWIRKCADIIRVSLGNIDIALRFGGDEFIVMYRNTDKESVASRLEAIRSTIKGEAASHNIKISISAGVCMVRRSDNYSFDLLLKKADEALYTSKDRGKDTYTFSEI